MYGHRTILFFVRRSPNALNEAKSLFSKVFLDGLGYTFYYIQSIVRMVHHAVVIHEDLPYRLYNISMNHKETVEKFLTDIDPNVYRTLVRSFSRLNFVEVNNRCVSLRCCCAFVYT